MINSNYYPYLYFLVAVFFSCVNGDGSTIQYIRYSDLLSLKTRVPFIDVDNALHPVAFCKRKVNPADGEWVRNYTEFCRKEVGYHELEVSNDICAKHITCRGTGRRDVTYLDRMPPQGARCQRYTQSPIYNFGYGCYQGQCVPITCLDENCWNLLKQKEEQIWVSMEQNTSPPSSDLSEQPQNERSQIYKFQSLPPARPIRNPYTEPPNSVTPIHNPYSDSSNSALPNPSPSKKPQKDASQIIRFDVSDSKEIH